MGGDRLLGRYQAHLEAVTAEYLLAAFDLRIDEFGEIVRVPEHLRVFNDRWVQTFWMGLVITFLCVVMGYPLAYLLAHLPTRISNLLMILVLLPFWVSILVRTTAWIVLLQNEGVLTIWDCIWVCGRRGCSSSATGLGSTW